MPDDVDHHRQWSETPQKNKHTLWNMKLVEKMNLWKIPNIQDFTTESTEKITKRRKESRNKKSLNK